MSIPNSWFIPPHPCYSFGMHKFVFYVCGSMNYTFLNSEFYGVGITSQFKQTNRNIWLVKSLAHKPVLDEPSFPWVIAISKMPN